jgi:hypothetical protein
MMRRALALLFLATAAAFGQVASPFIFYVHDTTGKLPDLALPATYQLPSTPVGNASPTVLKMVNASQNTVRFVLASVAAAANSSVASTNFSVTGFFQDLVLSPGGSVLFTVNFTPSVTGVISGFLNVTFQTQLNGCSFTGTVNVCPGNTASVSTLTGTGSPPQLILSYTPPGGSSTVLQPASSSPLNFPNTSLSATSTYTFTLANPTSVDVAAPAISLPSVNLNAPNAFALDVSSMPALIAAGQSANFLVTFAPSQTGLASGALQVGSNTYPIQGAGIIVADIDSLQISYTDSTGVRTLPQSATPISFGQVVPGSGASATLTFSVANPITSYNVVTIPGIAISGSAFSLSGVPAAPISVSPGNAISFKAAFTPTSAGTYTGGLAIGSRQFILGGVSVASPLPGFSLTLGAPLSSQQQATVTIQFSAPAAVSAVGTILLEFFPSVAHVTDDPAIVFLATGARQLPVTVVSGAQTANYKGASAIPFQTGTTAGTLKFTVTFANTAPYSQSFTITPASIQLTSAQALRQSPNLLVTVHGYDNTYSAGQLSFTFYDTSGKVIGSPIQFNAASSFQQLFFTNNTAGGVFSLQASFPVTGGDITQIGSVAVGIAGSLGQATTNATFQ